jgi:hypothetical protein
MRALCLQGLLLRLQRTNHLMLHLSHRPEKGLTKTVARSGFSSDCAQLEG